MNEQELQRLIDQQPEGSLARQVLERVLNNLRLDARARRDPMEPFYGRQRRQINRAISDYQRALSRAHRYPPGYLPSIEARAWEKLERSLSYLGGAEILRRMEQHRPGRSPGWTPAERAWLIANGVQPDSLAYSESNQRDVKELMKKYPVQEFSGMSKRNPRPTPEPAPEAAPRATWNQHEPWWQFVREGAKQLPGYVQGPSLDEQYGMIPGYIGVEDEEEGLRFLQAL